MTVQQDGSLVHVSFSEGDWTQEERDHLSATMTGYQVDEWKTGEGAPCMAFYRPGAVEASFIISKIKPQYVVYRRKGVDASGTSLDRVLSHMKR
jgi:hypothetical protein